jgi:carotenoid cleavage dioxygenase-like enzyme
MHRAVVVALLGSAFASLVAAKFDDSGFLGWFAGELQEVTDIKLDFDAKLPAYVRGHMVQAGPGSDRMGDYTFTHAFDGFAKVSRLHFGAEQRNGADSVTFSSNFMNSSFWKESNRLNKIVPAIMAGNTIPSQGFGPKGALAGHNDNNYVKCHKFSEAEMCLSDTAVATIYKDDFASFDRVIRPEMMGVGTNGTAWRDDANVFAHICATGIMAHGKPNPRNGNFVASVACLSPLEDELPSDYHVVFEIDPAVPDVRKVIKAVKLDAGRRASYMHSMAHTMNHVVLIAQPLHLHVAALMQGKGLADGATVLGNSTFFQAVSLVDGSVREWHHSSFLFSHVMNSWEDGDDIVIDLCWYQADYHMMFLGMFKKENLQKEKRDTMPPNKVMRFRLKNNGAVEETNLLPKEPRSLWDLPIVDPRLHGKQETCVAWFIQGACNAYDEEINSTKVGPMGVYGLAKRNLCTGERIGWYEPNEYPSEVSFIPNPESTEEDDGALVGIVFDANANSSYVHVRDARSLNLIARADLPIRVPFLVHGSWLPEGTSEMEVVV